MSETDITSLAGDPVFAEPWEAQAFALVVELHKQGVFTWGEWADTLSTVIAENESRPYYHSWLLALELISDVNGLVDPNEHVNRTQAWAAAEAATPHGEPILLERLVTGS